MDVRLINISQLSDICINMWQIVEDIDKTFDYHTNTKQKDNLKSCLFYYNQELADMNQQLENLPGII